MQLDIGFVRRQFPALSGDWTFFDNAGGSQTLGAVADRIQDYLLTSNVQLGASYEVSERAGARVTAARETMAAYVHANDASEVVIGPSTTMLLRILSICLGETLKAGDEVIVTNCDHEANIGPWLDLAKRGIQVRTWRVDPGSLELSLDDLRSLMTARTRLVAVTHTSNILGTLNPIREYARVVHEHGAMICVDGVAYAPHRLIDVQQFDVDFYAFSFYKVYGPHLALLYGRREHLLAIPGLNHYFIRQDDIPYKFQPGSVNYELSYGTLGLADYISAFARAHEGGTPPQDLRQQARRMFEIIARHEKELSSRLLDFLASKKRVRVIGLPAADPARRAPTISFVRDGAKSDAIVRKVDEHRIGIRYGDFYARRLIEALGVAESHGVVRVSMVHYNTLEEVDRLIGVLDPLL